METIHVKTVDPLSKELLSEACQKGLPLNWERYEQQQPQDGFLRLGLSCPYGCMQGPCRIDPFGRGAQNGVCGLGRDGMVAAQLLRISLQGAMECLPADPAVLLTEEILWPSSLKGQAEAALRALGGPVMTGGEYRTAVTMLARPSASPEKIIHQALRLGLLAAGLNIHEMEKTPDEPAAVCRVGYGLLAGDEPVIAFCGRPGAEMVEALLRKANAGNQPVRLVSLGDWITCSRGLIPIVCTSGEAETVLSSGKLHLLVAGSGTDPGILSLCEKMQMPVVDGEGDMSAEDIIQRVRMEFDRRNVTAFAPSASLVTEGQMDRTGVAFNSASNSQEGKKIALIGGSDSLFGSLGHLPVELAKGLMGSGFVIGAWNDAALWMLKQNIPAELLDAQKGPLTAVSSLAAAGRLSSLKGICFTGLRSCGEFAQALGLAALGMKVFLGTPIPLWGSDKVRLLLAEKLTALGGSLIHFDHPAKADELLECFDRQ